MAIVSALKVATRATVNQIGLEIIAIPVKAPCINYQSLDEFLVVCDDFSFRHSIEITNSTEWLVADIVWEGQMEQFPKTIDCGEGI